MLDLTDPKKYLTMNQQLWLERRYDEGRNVGVVVFGEPGHIWLPELEWKKPITPEKYLNQAMTMDELADTLVELFTESELK